ncbi:hypothetical protein M407DRAFT_231457 [Tulasnella calospora MUT 4182]|uniref:Uncharacterized protein n=1 Tax=Tulasnella calospora MUT 4182 TaxID=1051891 RepID=A0A0C3QMD2_9AGAM|nr:hypothetical protein M407DRAFT_231457 [Tulasnella calospora MUT 4182]
MSTEREIVENAVSAYLKLPASQNLATKQGDFRGSTVTASLDLASDGPSLRHVDTRGMGLPWHSHRFTNLRTISLRDFKHHIPQITHLYAILSSSPQLERLCMINIIVSDDESLGSLPTSVRPINLPLLKTLAFSHVSDTIGHRIIPLIRASACHTIVIDGESNFSAALEPQETTTQLIAKPIALSKLLKLAVEEGDATYICMRSEPVIANGWACWANDQPGVKIKLAIPSAEVIPRLWDYLGDALREHGGATSLESIEVEWVGQEIPFPFTLLDHCLGLTSLRFSDQTGAALDPLIQFLGGDRMNGSVVNSEPRFPLPKLSSLFLHGETILNLEGCADSIKHLLERRYPALRDGVISGDVHALKDLCLPFPLVDALQQCGLMTSFNLENLRGS